MEHSTNMFNKNKSTTLLQKVYNHVQLHCVRIQLCFILNFKLKMFRSSASKSFLYHKNYIYFFSNYLNEMKQNEILKWYPCILQVIANLPTMEIME